MIVEVRLGPNPVAEHLNYTLLNLERSCRLTIYDNLGREVQSHLIEPSAAEGSLDVNSTESGLYHCIIRDVVDDKLLHSQVLSKF